MSFDRASDRAVAVQLRISEKDRDDLVARATEHGMTMQGYLEYLAFGRITGHRKAGRRPNSLKDTPLPMTG